jgi:hypothetical protein
MNRSRGAMHHNKVPAPRHDQAVVARHSKAPVHHSAQQQYLFRNRDDPVACRNDTIHETGRCDIRNFQNRDL